jgi:hypothetical protein
MAAAAILVLAGAGAGAAKAGEAVKPADVPAPIVALIQKLAPQARIADARRETNKAGDESTYRLSVTSGSLPLIAKVDVKKSGKLDGYLAEVVAAKDLPTSIAKAARAVLKDGEIGESAAPDAPPTVRRALSLDKKDFGEATWRWDLDHPEREVRISADGAEVRIRENIKVKDLPKAIRATIEKKYPKSDLDKVDKIVENGAVTYRMTVKKSAGGEVEIGVTSAGEIMVLK